LFDEGMGLIAALAANVIRQDQTQHLLDRAPHATDDTSAGPFVAALSPSFGHPLLNERLNQIGEVSPDFSAARLGIGRETHEYGDPAIDVARRVLLLMEPCDIALNRFAEPASPYPILSLVFNKITFDHDNLLSEITEKRSLIVEPRILCSRQECCWSGFTSALSRAGHIMWRGT